MLDVASIVSGLMEIENKPLNLLDTKIAASNTKISLIGQFQSKLSNVQTALTALQTPSNFTGAVSSSSSAVATALATANVQAGRYNLEVELDGDGMLIKGTIKAPLECDCARCLKSFPMTLEIPDFLVVTPMEGEEAPTKDGDFADLTPFVRADTLLALPTKPLCNPECRGLPALTTARDLRPEEKPKSASPWGPLDRLNL